MGEHIAPELPDVYDAGIPREHAEVPLWGCEDLYWEDFEIGYRIRTIRRTITEGESATFNNLVVDIHPYVSDDVFAVREGLFKRRLVAGAFVFSAGIGLVATRLRKAFSYGYDRLRFVRPAIHRRDLHDPHEPREGPKYGRGLGRAETVSRARASSPSLHDTLQTVLPRDPATAKGRAPSR